MIEKIDNKCPLITAINAEIPLDNARNFLFYIGISEKQAADILGVTPRTVREYTHKNRMPKAAIIALYTASGRLVHKGFTDWVIIEEKLQHQDAREGVNSSEIRNLVFLKGVYQRVMEENQQLKATNSRLVALFNAEQVPLHLSYSPLHLWQIVSQNDQGDICHRGERISYHFQTD